MLLLLTKFFGKRSAHTNNKFKDNILNNYWIMPKCCSQKFCELFSNIKKRKEETKNVSHFYTETALETRPLLSSYCFTLISSLTLGHQHTSPTQIVVDRSKHLRTSVGVGDPLTLSLSLLLSLSLSFSLRFLSFADWP